MPAVWNVPPRNRHFTGRDGLFERIDAGLPGGPGGVTALYGMGGVGKTQLAIEYAWRHADDYQLVWWVDAEQTVLVAERIAGWPAGPGCARRDAGAGGGEVRAGRAGPPVRLAAGAGCQKLGPVAHSVVTVR
ncbi:hypothetical protein [Frankia sp. Cj3]|uniref:hypothetical protein n=1 Tax=Frankia sp. Cj3 TaxID=2880976 RepID=UPI001EF549C2|nr:hypothetical protein [Frankia sp. Cj3]